MSDDTPRRKLTPCYISRSTPRCVQELHAQHRVRVHSRTDPCGHLTRDDRGDPIPTFAEWVDDWLADRRPSLVECSVCGHGLL